MSNTENQTKDTSLEKWDLFEDYQKRVAIRKIYNTLFCSWDWKMQQIEQILNGDKKVLESYRSDHNKKNNQ